MDLTTVDALRGINRTSKGSVQVCQYVLLELINNSWGEKRGNRYVKEVWNCSLHYHKHFANKKVSIAFLKFCTDVMFLNVHGRSFHNLGATTWKVTDLNMFFSKIELRRGVTALVLEKCFQERLAFICCLFSSLGIKNYKIDWLWIT